MKTTQLIQKMAFTGFLAICTGFTAMAQPACHASFTSAQTAPNNITFTNTSTGTTASTVYLWSFGDGYRGRNAATMHTYYNPGIYLVCLKIYDSLTWSCHSISCDTVRVSGNVICHLSAEACSHPASCSICTNGSAAVVDIDNGKGPYTYSWSNGATTRVDTGLAPGNYVVCVTDANHCTACDTVTVGVITPHCHAYFFLRRDTTATVTYFAVSNSLGARPFHYLWTWGDGSPADTARYPVHTYANPGAYTICLTITTANGCTSTWCRTLHAHSPTTDPFAPLKIAVIEEPETATGISEQTEGLTWSLYPNPSSDLSLLTYSHAEASDIQIEVYDLRGRLVNSLRNITSEPGGDYQLNINTAALREGSYLIQIHTSSASDTKRLNVIH